MSYLINRNPSARVICLHSLAQYLAASFADNKFLLNDLKYDSGSKLNIHNFCPLVENHPAVSFKVCPYLENPLSLAKCYLTQSIQEDTQKSKSASDAFRALEGLGFVSNAEGARKLTQAGHEFAEIEYYSKEMFSIIRTAMLGYGPFFGLLAQVLTNSNDKNVINRNGIALGYPETNEVISINGQDVQLSTASQDDTITRTRSLLITWAITSGFLLPKDFKKPKDQNYWHIDTLEYILKKKSTCTKFDVFVPESLFDGMHKIERPLEYDAMTKTTRALRERNQEDQRSLTLKYESIIQNRRYAIAYLLGIAAQKQTGVDFDKLINSLKSNGPTFVINQDKFKSVLQAELEIASITGIPFNIEDRILWPVSKINLDVLSIGAPKELRQFLDTIAESVFA